MSSNKKILLIDNITTLSRNNIRVREHREIDTIMSDKRYHPYMIVTEAVLLNKPLQFFKIKSFVDNRVEIYRIPSLAIGSLSSNRTLGKVGKLLFALCNILFQLVYLLHLTMLALSLVKAKKIQLIHAHNPPDLTGVASLIVSKIARIPYIFEIHDRAPELYCGDLGVSQSSLVFTLMKLIEKLVVRNSAGLITVNERVAKYYELYDGPKPVAIYTGSKIITEESFSSNLSSFDLQRLSNKCIILYQGSLNLSNVGDSAIYDLELPLKALPIILKDFPDAILVYVGDGTGRQKLEKEAILMGLSSKVIFTGFVLQNQVFSWIKQANVVLIPYADNPNNHTTVPSKLYEYMAVGKPIVATRFPGILEILVHEHNSLLYTVKSVEEFSNAVLRILSNPEFATYIATNAKNEFASKYSIEKNWPKLISLYDSLIND